MRQAGGTALIDRVAGAPISWGVCEVPGWGYQMPPERVLSEMAGLGLRATEAGPDGYLPTAPARMADLLAAYGLSLVGGFLPLRLHDRTDETWRDTLSRITEHFAAAGGDAVVMAAASDVDDYDARPELTDSEWNTLLANLDAAAQLVAERGLRASLHPHVGTVVERPVHIDRVLSDSSVPLCWDTGHVMAGGDDPLRAPRDAPQRIGHVHLKDVDGSVAARVAAGALPYGDAVKRGLYRPLGAGDANIAELVELLAAADYPGWLVLEQDVALDTEPPPRGGPVTDVKHSLAFLETLMPTRSKGARS